MSILGRIFGKKKKRNVTTNDYGLYDISNPLSPFNAKLPEQTSLDADVPEEYGTNYEGGNFGGAGASGGWDDGGTDSSGDSGGDGGGSSD